MLDFGSQDRLTQIKRLAMQQHLSGSSAPPPPLMIEGFFRQMIDVVKTQLFNRSHPSTC